MTTPHNNKIWVTRHLQTTRHSVAAAVTVILIFISRHTCLNFETYISYLICFQMNVAYREYSSSESVRPATKKIVRIRGAVNGPVENVVGDANVRLYLKMSNYIRVICVILNEFITLKKKSL